MKTGHNGKLPAVEPVMLSITNIRTCQNKKPLTNATGFFFRRDDRLYLITNRHVVVDEASKHHPDELLIRLFNDPDNLAQTVDFSIPILKDHKPLWIQATDSAGVTDVVAILIDQTALPANAQIRAFSPATLCPPEANVEVGSVLMVVGFPLGFSDTLHNLPVARQASLASSFGLRFQGMGYFLTDALTHRGISGAPVIQRVSTGPGDEPDFHWQLLGVHSSRLDVTRDLEQDQALGLNCAWYADVLLTLTEPVE